MCVTALSHSFANAALAANPSRASSLLHQSEVLATIRNRGPYQWQAQLRKKRQPLQTRTFETRAEAEQWARLIEIETDKGGFVSRAETESTPSTNCWNTTLLIQFLQRLN